MAKTGTVTRIALLTLTVAAAASCSDKPSTNQGPLPESVASIIFLQRQARNNTGNVFDYTSYVPGAKLVTLTPPSADGKLVNVTSDPMFATADIMSYDLSFDAKTVVFSAKLSDADRYQLFKMNLDGTNIKQLTMGDYDYVYPIFTPGDQVMFMTNKDVEPDSKQFQDEYERQVTAQVGTINGDGTNETLGARNVSHRVSPALLPNGRVAYTEWRHMGMVNDGHIRMMNADMTGMREAFGGEDGAVNGTNSYLKARYVQTTTLADGSKDYQLIAVGTSRDRTLQAGKLLLIDLNESEELSDFKDLTPLVPGGNGNSALGVGRYYDAEVVDASAQKFLVSWADGPVESEFLAMAGSVPNFGIYVYDGKSQLRYPIYDAKDAQGNVDVNVWDVLARPIAARQEPPVTSSPISGTSTTVGALNVYDSSIATIPAGSVQKVRLIEGFSGEEGIRTFGTTEFDGQSLYGEIPIAPDNSFAAKVPGNVPFHMQVIDKFAMSIVNESVWISGRAGEQRFCGGCHENRSKTALISPGVTANVLLGAVNLDVPRADRQYIPPAGTAFTADVSKIRGVPWDKAIQPILTAKCASCHDGDATKAGNPSYTVTDRTTMTSQTFTFDLRGQNLQVTVGEKMTGLFSASYISLMGLGEILGEDVVEITPPDYTASYVEAGAAAKSTLLTDWLNAPQRFPVVDETVRMALSKDAMRAMHQTTYGPTLTPDEYYLLILSIDMGGQYFSRENKEEATDPYMGGK